MDTSILVTGSEHNIAQLLSQITTRIRSGCIIIDPLVTISESHFVYKPLVIRPRTPYQLRHLIDGQLERHLRKTGAGLIVFPSLTHLFSSIPPSEVPLVLDYVFDQVVRLARRYEAVIILADEASDSLYARLLASRVDATLDLSSIMPSRNI